MKGMKLDLAVNIGRHKDCVCGFSVPVMAYTIALDQKCTFAENER
jgi:hypothetical protein